MVGSGSGCKIWSDPDPVFKIWLNPDPVFKPWWDPDPRSEHQGLHWSILAVFIDQSDTTVLEYRLY